MQKASSDSQKFIVPTVEWPDTIQELDEQIKKDPRDARLWFERGLKLGDARLMHDAITSFSRAIALDPFNGIYYRWRGHRHLNINQIAEACAETNTLMEINSRHGHLTEEEIAIAAEVPDVKFILSSDAHVPDAVGNCRAGLDRALAAGLDPRRIVNIRKKDGKG